MSGRRAAKRKVLPPAHLKKMEALDAERRVILAGPLTDGAGSLIVITAGSLAEAEAFVQTDPLQVNGVFEHVGIRSFQQVFPQENRDA